MIVRPCWLSRLALLWVFALVVAFAPWLGRGHAGADPVEAVALHGRVQGAGQGEGAVQSASVPMLVHSADITRGGMSHGCPHHGGGGPAVADAPLMALDPAPGHMPAPASLMTGCEDMCRMVCHEMVILSAISPLHHVHTQAHEPGPVATLETLAGDVLVPPPRQTV